MSKIKDFLNRIRHSYYVVAKVIAFLVAIVLVCWQMPRTGKFKYEYQLSKPWQHETLYAPFDFPIYKDDETLNAETEAVAAKVKPIFVFNDEEMTAARNALFNAFEARWSGNSDKEYNLDELFILYDSIEDQGIVAYDNATSNLAPETEVSVIRNKVMRTVRYGDFYSMNEATEAVAKALENIDKQIDTKLLSELLNGALRQNVFYNAEITKLEKEKAVSAISLTYGMVQKDEIIVSEGEIISPHTFDILNSLQHEYTSRSMSSDESLREYTSRSMSSDESLRVLLSQLFLVALIFTLMGLYGNKLHKKVFSELKNIVLLLTLMLIVIIPSYVLVKFEPGLVYLMPVCLLAIMVSSFFNLRLALYPILSSSFSCSWWPRCLRCSACRTSGRTTVSSKRPYSCLWAICWFMRRSRFCPLPKSTGGMFSCWF